ncbi:hypothetical protein [Allofranklinella schreckenbergeri]|uniref:hypothetical protein n=1 Tax=Allofranklinella schreckenbergeri TaxID=1076744 RepID=UPI0011C3C6B9|nr:hypothetical protein [Allofranklinella schreckenbergeri]
MGHGAQKQRSKEKQTAGRCQTSAAASTQKQRRYVTKPIHCRWAALHAPAAFHRQNNELLFPGHGNRGKRPMMHAPSSHPLMIEKAFFISNRFRKI